MASPNDAEHTAVVQQATNGNLNGLAVQVADASQSQSGSQYQRQPSFDAAQVSAATTKRKREDSDDGDQNMLHVDDKPKPNANSTFTDDRTMRDEKDLIKNYFQVLQRYDTETARPIYQVPTMLIIHFYLVHLRTCSSIIHMGPWLVTGMSITSHTPCPFAITSFPPIRICSLKASLLTIPIPLLTIF